MNKKQTLRTPIKRCIKALVVFIFLGSQPTLATQELTMSCGLSPDSPLTKALLNRYNTALAPLDIRLKLINTSAAEDYKLFAEKKVDSTCSRAGNFMALSGLKNITRITKSGFNARYFYIHKKHSEPSRTPLRAAFIKGHILSKNTLNLRGYEVVQLESLEDVFTQLSNGSLDRALVWEEDIYENQQRIDENDIAVADMAFAMPTYSYFNSGHEKTAQFLSRAFNALANERGNKVQNTLDEFTPNYTYTPTHKRHYGKTITFTCGVPIQSAIYQTTYPLYEKAFNQLGMNFEMVYVTRKRGVINLLAGKSDGLCGRVSNFGDITKGNIERVNVPTSSMNISIFSTQPDAVFQSYSDIDPSQKITYVRGTKHLEWQLDKHNLQAVPSPDTASAIEKLSRGDVDYYIALKDETELTLHSNPIDKEIYNSGNLETIALYPFLHSKNRPMLKPLEHQLKLLTGQ